MKIKIGMLAMAMFTLVCSDVRAAAPSGAEMFASPRAAVDALLAAVAQDETGDILTVLGPDGKDVVFSGDDTADRTSRNTFLAAAREKTVLDPATKTTVLLKVGEDEWAFPIPLVKGPKGWYFDTAAGREELISRRIGRNELSVIALCQAFVTAEREYAQTGGASPGVYAQKLLSTEGKRDGLYWPITAGEPESPLGPLAAEAANDGYEAKAAGSGPRAFHGYFFKIMTSQGEHASGGASSYVVDGKMTGGFALVAWPAEYRVGGVMTFVVNQAGIVFEKDLGPTTPERAKGMAQFDPDLTWKPAKL